MNTISIPNDASLTTAAGASWRTGVPALRRVARRNIFGLRGLTITRFAWTFAFAAGFSLWSASANILGDRGHDISLVEVAEALSYWFVRYCIGFVPQMLTLTLADNLPLQGARRVAAFVLALVLGATAIVPLTRVAIPGECPECMDYASWAGAIGNQLLGSLVYASVIAAAYLSRRRDAELAAALHASQLARADARRKALEAELQVLQARVEPAFLFDALRDVASLYETEPRAGDRLLDQLIQYLRAALPQMRVSGSTVAKEAGLLRAYLNILALRAAGNFAVVMHVAKGLNDARVPPLMLAPLVAPPAGAQAAAPMRCGSIRIDIRTMDGRLRIAFAAAGDMARSMADSPAVEEVRGRLAALYGPSAALVVDRIADDRLQLILEMPHERADRGDR
jgi:hypothetical protein